MCRAEWSGAVSVGEKEKAFRPRNEQPQVELLL